MFKKGVFLSAEWKHLIMLNYEVDPSLLTPLIPAGTELDLWQGKALVSVVGFMFLNTHVLGCQIPFFTDFEEVNLRFYIKRGDRRAVAFIKEIVPRWAIAYVARTLYHEKYVSMPMRHRIDQSEGLIHVNYEWKLNNQWQTLHISCEGEPQIPLKGSEIEFITEHFWGYAGQPNTKTIEYQVEHPTWRVWQAKESALQANIKELFGEEFEPYLSKPPISSFLAEGSPVQVYKGSTF